MDVLTRNYNGHGGGWISPDRRLFYINISKNASSYMASVLPSQGWAATTMGDGKDHNQLEKIIVILRDPVDRWCSGVAQYLVTLILNFVGPNSFIDESSDKTFYPITAGMFLECYSGIIERFIFDNLDLLDDHVWMQSDFFEKILPDVPRHYVWMNFDFEHQLEKIGISRISDPDYNHIYDNPDKLLLRNFFLTKLEQTPTLMKRVKMTYARDYELLDSVFPDRICQIIKPI
jgi:hypothetical protein